MSQPAFWESPSDPGLLILHDPPQAEVDIVFIHDVDGHRLESWTDSDTSACWPRDFLPEAFPKARILTYGYDARRLREKISKNTRIISNDAKDLWIRLEMVRDVFEFRPLIFLAHGFGGVFCKKAIILADDGRVGSHRELFRSIFGIVFIGTPHQEFLTTNVGLAGGFQALTHSLKMGAHGRNISESEVLKRIDQKFWNYLDHQGRRVKILDCFEQVETPKSVLVVPESYAREPKMEKVSLPGGHAKMVKFGNKEDIGFLKISHVLKTWIGELQIGEFHVTKRTKRDASYPVESADRSRCLDSLAVYSQDESEAEKDVAVGAHEPFLHTYAWRRWMNFNDPSAQMGHLWIKGRLGSGKSTLLRFLISYIEAQKISDILPLAFFFKSSRQPSERSAVGLYGFLLYRLLQIAPGAWVDFLPLLIEREKNRSIDTGWSREELSVAFEMVLSACTPEYGRLVIFIGALDECEDREEAQDVVKHLCKIRDSLQCTQKTLKICWSARKHIINPNIDKDLLIRWDSARYTHIQSVDSLSLLTVHNAILTKLANHYIAKSDIEIEWEVSNFMHTNFESSQPLGPVLVLVGVSYVTQAATCAEYIESKWGNFGLAILDFADSMLRKTRQNTAGQSKNFHTSRTIIEDLNVVADWQSVDGLSLKETISIQADGPLKNIAALIEIFSWLTAALRNTSIHGVSCSDVSVEIFTFKESQNVLQCSIKLRELESLSGRRPGSCWFDMYKSTIVVNSLTSNGSAPGAGLDIDLHRLANLTGATTPIEYEGGILLLGRSSILVPVARLENEGLLWHLLYSSGKEQIELSDADSQFAQRLLIKDTNELLSITHHRVGLWSTYKIILGTNEACYDNIEWTSKSEKKSMWQHQGFSVPLTLGIPHGPSLGLVNNFVAAKQQLNSSSGEVDYVALILDFSKRPLLVYDPHPEGRQAWLVPTLSFVLHLVHLYVRYYKLEVELPYAKAVSDGGAAALEAIKGRAEDMILALGSAESNSLTLGSLLKIMCLNILRMAPKKSRLPFGAGTQIMGYEFGDIAKADPQITLRKSKYAFNAAHEAWSSYFSSRVTFILCKGLGSVIVPHEGEYSSVTQKDMLIAPLQCLVPLVQKSSGNLEQGVLGGGHYLHSPHPPFGPCDQCHALLERNHCDRIQCIEKSRWLSASRCADADRYGVSGGAIVIGRSVKARKWPREDSLEVVIR